MNGTEPTTPNTPDEANDAKEPNEPTWPSDSAPVDPVDPTQLGPAAVDPAAGNPVDGPGFVPPPTAPAPSPAPAGSATQPGAPFAAQRRRVRTGPIVWGSLILVLCAFVVQLSLAPGAVEPAVWISGTVLGLGVLLLGVSAGILARNARDRRKG